MKINLVGPASPLRGGIANFNDSLFAALEKKHDAGIIGFSLQYPSVFFPGKSQYEKGAPHAGVRPKQLINSINPLSWRKAAAEIVKMMPDCLIVHYWMPFFAPALGSVIRRVKKKHKVCVIGLLHNLEPHEKMVASGRLNRYFLESCDGFITMSSTVMNDLKMTGTVKPVKVIPHPVYDFFGESVSRQVACDYLGLDQDQHHLLFFGIVRSYKGLDLLFRSLANNRVSHINLKLLVAGEFYENENKYLDLAERLGVEKMILFTNSFVPKEDVGHYFSASDMVVLPYLTATQSGVTQIAYHFNKPMLVTNVGGLKDVVPHGRVGYVCEKDPDEIAAAIADFFDNNRSADFIRNIKSEKKKYSWNSFVKGIEELVKEIREKS
ncbi:MAG: glycosyltransferase [Bacteroidales bacterium]